MEDGVKRGTDNPEGTKFVGKEGWVKKCSGKILGSYKPCYIRVEKSEIAVYENEDLQKCTERLKLENYDKCLELKSAFKKKNRLVLIRAPKCGNKIHDVKLQTQTHEEKEAWIKHLSDAINRAKNKIFDEIKVEESYSLEHVTLTRPKGNQKRRPPTRIHLKEAAVTSSNGILRLDLDATDSSTTASSMTHWVDTDVSTPCQKVKPPMPPVKSTESTENTPNEKASPQQKVVKPPMPPSSQNKPRLLFTEESQHEMTPTDKEESKDQISASLSPPSKNFKPPMPPSKDKKPSRVPEEDIHIYTENKKDEDDEELPAHMLTNNDTAEMVIKEEPPPTSPEKPIKPLVAEDESSTQLKPVPEEQESIPHTITTEVEDNKVPAIISNGEIEKSESPFSLPPESFPEPVKKITGRPVPPNKRLPKHRLKAGDGNQATSTNVPSSTEIIAVSTSNICISDKPHVVPRSQNPIKTEDLMLSSEHKETSFMCWDGSDESAILSKGTEDMEVKASEIDKDLDKQYEIDKVYEGEAPQICSNQLVSDSNPVKSDGKAQTMEINSPTILINQDKGNQSLQLSQCEHGKFLTTPLQPLHSLKGKCASVGDLLCGSMEESGVSPVEGPFLTCPSSVIGELQNKVALELENTEKLLNTVTPQTGQTTKEAQQWGSLEYSSPSELLATAVEKLRKADQFLKEVKSLTLEKRNRRTSL
ncbi:pleckstrin homology domain-containing family O member 2 isoform X2 [Arapaima gigas]